MNKSSLMLTVCVVALAWTINAQAPRIRGGNYGNWWVLGDTVRFSLEKGEINSPVTVKLYDSQDGELSSHTIPANDFQRNGWTVVPDKPGFYEVEFHVGEKAVAESWTLKLSRQDQVDKRKYVPLGEKEFAVSRHPFVIAPAKTRPVNEISPHFGVSPHFGMYKNAVPLGRLVGFKNIRIHALTWYSLEKEKGKINWSQVDDFMRVARENGYSDENIIFNIYGVPKWASTRPEADWINICVPEYATVIPRDMEDWKNFLREIMKRYPGVKTYELWNEPHLVGFSCFWSDSVENFVTLLKAGYETIKSEKPDATVWLGGIALRYLPFYDQLLKLGGGKYFDVLPLHGSWQNPAPFHELEIKHGLEPKPVVSSEWHAMLIKANMYPDKYPSEKILARNMLLDFLNLVRGGVTEVDFFCVLNLYRTEKETLEFYREHKSFNMHVSGLFRQVPYIQPRLPALAWHNWISWVKGMLKVQEGYLFDANRQRALCMESDNGQMLLIWNNSEKPLTISPRLLECVDGNSKILDMEGREHRFSPDFKLPPEEYFMVFSPKTSPMDNWKDFRGEVLIQFNAKIPLKHDYQAVYRSGKLFDGQFNLIQPETLRFFPVEKTVHYNPAIPAGKVKGKFAVGLTPELLDLVVEVDDPIHVNTATDMRVWEFDSIQFALDTTGEGYANRCLEFAAALHENGEASLWKVIAPGLEGDLPGQYSPATEKVRYGKTQIARKDGKTIYKVSINASELYPFALGMRIAPRFCLLINNNDGKGRAAYIEWASGIGGAKNPGEFGDLTPQAKESNFPGQKQLIHKSWNKTDYDLEFSENSVKVIGGSPLCSGVGCGAFAVTPGAAYRITFEARGKARLQCMVNGKGIKRLDPLPPTPLSQEWQKFDLSFLAPATAESAQIMLFAWQQPGCEFEIRDFSVRAL